MTYTQALNKIHSLDKFGSRPGLDRVKKLFDLIGDGLTEQKFIHVAGTNGKGSVCAMLSSILIASGYKTGLFISPYITDFRERIQINGEPVSEKMLTRSVEFMLPYLDRLSQDGIIITEFEFLTAIAFYIFKNQNCDIIVCETGLGGLLDSTNVIKKPICSVITKIDFDHTAILGNTITDIANQKCGIIKRNSITVSSTQCNEAMSVINKTSKAQQNKLYVADSIIISDAQFSIEKTSFSYDGNQMSIHMLGSHQIDNAKTALCTIKALKENNIINSSALAIRTGLSHAVNPARFEVLSLNNPLVILDGAHNPNGMSAFSACVKRYVNIKNKILIIGMLKDKDIDTALMHIEGMFDTVITTDIDNPRNLSAENLLKKCCNKFNEVISVSKPSRAFDLAYEKALKSDSAILVCGSLYLAGEIRPYIIKKLRK